MNKKKHIFSLISLILIICMLFCSCRPSIKLVEVIYDQEANKIDDHDNVIDPDKLAEEIQKHIPERKQDDNTDDARDRKQDNPNYGNEKNNKSAAEVEYDSDSTEKNKTNQNTSGTASSDKDNISNTSGTEVSYKHIYDPNSGLANIPENVDKVVAVGQAASMVMMLGGKGRLVASNSNFTGNSLAKSVFASNGIAKVKTLWSGDGSSRISDSNLKILVSLKPDVCFEISGQNTFSNSQINTLVNNGISYVVLPPFRTTENIKISAFIIGKVLGNRSSNGGTNAPAIAEKFNEYIDDTVKSVSSKITRVVSPLDRAYDYDHDRYTSGQHKILANNINYSTDAFYTVFIADWESGTNCKVYKGSCTTLSRQGAAVTYSGYSWSTFTYFMSLAGVLPSSIVPYEGTPKTGVKRWYVNPLIPSTRDLLYSGGNAGMLDVNYCLTQFGKSTGTNGSQGSLATSLGSSKFPGIIVANNSIASAINSQKYASGNEFWKIYPIVSAISGNASAHGFLDEEGQIIRSSIVGDYSINVIPSGVDEWWNGSAESILAIYWIGEKFGAHYTATDVKTKIKEFYSIFYKYELSEAQVNTIYNGK